MPALPWRRARSPQAFCATDQIGHQGVRDDAADAGGKLDLLVARVDDERVDQPRVAAGDLCGRRAACEPLQHPVGRAFHRFATDQRADGDAGDVRRAIASRISATARIGPIETYGLLGASTIRSAAASASSTPGAATASAAPGVVHGVDLVSMASPDEPGLERKRPGRSLDEGSHRLVARRQQRHIEAQGTRELRGHLRKRCAVSQQLRADEMQAEVAVAEREPRLAAELGDGLEGAP